MKDGEAGFTLLEVVAALAILVLFLVPMLGAVTQGMRSVESSRKRELALTLAQNKMTEIEMLKIPDTEGSDDGDFGKDYPDYRWEEEAVKTPELQLMEQYLPGLQAMEIHLRVIWTESGAEKSVQLNTLLME
jgi:general secretion pathway protein I